MGSLSPLIDFGRNSFSSGSSRKSHWMPSDWKLIDLHDLSINVVGLTDGNSEDRLDWLRANLPEANGLQISEIDGGPGLSLAEAASGDAIILHGSDLETLLAFTGRCRNLAGSRIVIVLIDQFSSIRAAALLNAGADDVLSFGQSPSEVRARISSSVRRRRISLENKLLGV